MSEVGGGSLAAPGALLVLALVLTAGLGIDGVRKAQQIADADAIAGEAARAGAQQIDVTALRRGRLELDAAQARHAAVRFAEATGATATATVTPDGRVRVEIGLHTETILLGLIGIDTVSTTGSAESEPMLIPSEGLG